jgi:hypothetical protein
VRDGRRDPTMLYPSERGQFRSPIERRQTIDLFCDMLSTYDFLPDEAAIDQALSSARDAVDAYLGG